MACCWYPEEVSVNPGGRAEDEALFELRQPLFEGGDAAGEITPADPGIGNTPLSSDF